MTGAGAARIVSRVAMEKDWGPSKRLAAGRRILTYKMMLAGGYERVARAVREQNARQLLQSLADGERQDAQAWGRAVRSMAEAGAEIGGRAPSRDRKLRVLRPALRARVRLMMAILGRRAFFEWVLVAEDESLEDLSVLLETAGEPGGSEMLSRLAFDERVHIERVKKEILGMEAWEMGSGGGVRDVVFGANDGLVSILALVAGVYGAVTESHLIFMAGVTGAVAGAISMGAGAYLSAKSENEVTERENRRKGIKKKQSPEEEREELSRFYRAKGFGQNEARAVAARISAGRRAQASYSVGEETGLTGEQSWPPLKAAALTGLSFAVVSLIPILPFAFLPVTAAVITALGASTAGLFGVGASKAVFTRKGWVRSGIEMMLIGTLAAAATYGIGLLIPV